MLLCHLYPCWHEIPPSVDGREMLRGTPDCPHEATTRPPKAAARSACQPSGSVMPKVTAHEDHHAGHNTVFQDWPQAPAGRAAATQAQSPTGEPGVETPVRPEEAPAPRCNCQVCAVRRVTQAQGADNEKVPLGLGWDSPSWALSGDGGSAARVQSPHCAVKMSSRQTWWQVSPRPRAAGLGGTTGLSPAPM